MNNFCLLLGICCQFLFAVYFISQAISKQTAKQLRVKYATSALVFGLFGGFLVYGWQTLGSTPANTDSQEATTKPVEPASQKSENITLNKTNGELYASVSEKSELTK